MLRGLRLTLKDFPLRADAFPATPRQLNVIVLTALGVLFLLTGVLAQAYHEGRRARAASQFNEAQHLVREGRAPAALEHFRAALALSRDSLVYRRALAFALWRSDRRAEARAHLETLLREDPVDAEANLLLARLSTDSVDEAERFYQRALYGRWAADAAMRRIDARFELVDWLLGRQAWTKARGELFRLAADLPDDPALQGRLASGFLQVGEDRTAVKIYREILAQRPDDAEAARGLVLAEFAGRRYAAARTAAARGLARHPRDEVLLERHAVASAIVAMDPTQPRLAARDRASRARRLLDATAKDLETCSGASSGGAPPEVAQAIADARKAVQADVATAIAQAERLWALREHVCPIATASGPLPLVFARLLETGEAP
jgi:tetratricopeptide (TPR) repeat protein